MAFLETVQIATQPHARPRQVRISTRVKHAVEAMVERGLRREDAAKEAGLTDNALYIALRKPETLAYRNDRMRVFRESAASRSIARVDRLADEAVSEHVKLGANELLMGIEGIGKVQRSENIHVHQGSVPGLTIVFNGQFDEARLIADQPLAIENAKHINDLPVPVPHPSMRNATIESPAPPPKTDRSRRPPGGGI
jgi:hypothetical protein